MTHSELFNGIPSGYELVQGRKTFNQRVTLTGLTEQLRIFNPNKPNSPTQFTVDSTGRLTVSNGIGITLTGVSSTLTIGGGFNFNQLVTIAANLTITSVGTLTYGTVGHNFNTGFASTAVSGYQMRGSTTAAVFGISAGSRAVSLGGGAVGSVFAVATSSITITTPGQCPIVASAAFKPFTIVETAGTASLCATVYIDGVPSGSVSSSYALLVSGSSRFDGTITASLNGVASTPAFIANGTIFTGGTATTTKPLVLIEPAGTTSTGWSTSGTGLGVNAASGFTGNVIDTQVNGTSVFKVAGNGVITANTNNSSFATVLSTGLTITSGQGSNNIYITFKSNAGTTFFTVREITGPVINPTFNFTGSQTMGTAYTDAIYTNYNPILSASVNNQVINAVNIEPVFANGSFTGVVNNLLNLRQSAVSKFKVASDGTTTAAGNLIFSTAGKGVQYQSGTDARAGNATLVAGTITVTNTTVTANTIIMLTRKTSGGTLGNLTYTLSAATSFTINSDNALDTSTVSYMLIEVN